MEAIGSILGMSGSVFWHLVDPKGGTNLIRVEAIGTILGMSGSVFWHLVDLKGV